MSRPIVPNFTRTTRQEIAPDLPWPDAVHDAAGAPEGWWKAEGDHVQAMVSRLVENEDHLITLARSLTALLRQSNGGPDGMVTYTTPDRGRVEFTVIEHFNTLLRNMEPVQRRRVLAWIAGEWSDDWDPGD